MRKLALLLLLLPYLAKAQTLPTLPQAQVNIQFPTQLGTTCAIVTTPGPCGIRNVTTGVTLQGAINASSCGDTIVLTAGTTYSGNFTIPSTSCSGWIEIVSSALASLPAAGNRVAPSNVGNMATISTPNTSPAIAFLPSSNHWRLMGLEITTSMISTTNPVFFMTVAGLQSDNNTRVTVLAQLPTFIIYDRIYIHGLSNTYVRSGFTMGGGNIAVVDSYCSEIHDDRNDSQCFGAYNGQGPFLLQNNFIQASTENTLFGGADPGVTNLVQSDITYVGNLVDKNVAWRTQAAPLNWSVKNCVEFKNAQRILFDGNVVQHCWQDAQPIGNAMLVTPRNQNGTCSWCVVNDLTVTHNIFQHAAAGIQTSGSDNAFPSLTLSRFLIQNNVFNDISSATWGPNDASNGMIFFSSCVNGTTSLNNGTWSHNTGFPDRYFMVLGGVTNNCTMSPTQETNELSGYGPAPPSNGGVVGTNLGSGINAINSYLPGTVWNQDILMTSTGGGDGNTYPVGTIFTSQANIQFTNFAGANFQLLASSPYHNAGTDGKDIGVWDWTCLNATTNAALAGNYNASTPCFAGSSDTAAPPLLSAGIIDPSRAIDWTKAGIPTGLPDAAWTSCGTLNPGVNSAGIRSAWTACTPGQFLLLNPGTYNLTAPLNLSNENQVVLRGSGASTTHLVFTGGAAFSGCTGFNDVIQMFSADCGNQVSGSGWVNFSTVTAGTTQGSTSITAALTGITPAGNSPSILFLSACDTGYSGFPCAPASGVAGAGPVDNSNFFVCAQYSFHPWNSGVTYQSGLNPFSTNGGNFYAKAGYSISAISRTSNVVTATIGQTSTLPVGTTIIVSGNLNDTSFNGTFTVTTASGSTVTYSQSGANASSSGGTMTPSPNLNHTPTDTNWWTLQGATPTTAGGCDINGPIDSPKGNWTNRYQYEVAVAASTPTGGIVSLLNPIQNPNLSGSSPMLARVQGIYQTGIENLSIDTSAVTGGAFNTIEIQSCYQCFVSGISEPSMNTRGINVQWSYGTHIQNNYIAYASTVDPYAIRFHTTGYNLVQNNIIQSVRSPVVFDGSDNGTVVGYNFCINNHQPTNDMWQAFWSHAAGDDLELREGNMCSGDRQDWFHGHHMMITNFRNFYTGWESCAHSQCGASTSKTAETNPIERDPVSRYVNDVGNILGTPGYHSTYSACTFVSVYFNGCTDSVVPEFPADPLVDSTGMKWANWDSINRPTPTGKCTTAEVPSGISPFPNPVPTAYTCTSGALPPSFYLTAKPSWWQVTGVSSAALPWPGIGPDITTGNIGECSTSSSAAAGLNTASQFNGVPSPDSAHCVGSTIWTGAWAGHINWNPAMAAYLTLGGNVDGSSAALSNFDANIYSGAAPPNPTATLTPNPLAFGNQNVGTTSSVLNAVFANTSGAGVNVTITGITVTGHFTQTGGSCTVGLVVAPGNNCNIGITFSPNATGPFTGTVSVTSNAVPSPTVANLTGTGTQATITWSSPQGGTAYNFGNIPVSSSINSANLTLSNTGSGPLNVAVTIGGTNPAQFSIISNTCPNPLPALASCTFVVRFTATAATTYTASLTETDSNASNSPQSLTMSGSGFIPVVNPVVNWPAIILQ